MDKSMTVRHLTSPDRQYLDRMSRVDGCPECVVNYSLPTRVNGLRDGGFIAAYECEACGATWATSYGSDD